MPPSSRPPRMPGLKLSCEVEASPSTVQSFSMSTPRKAVSDQPRHYIGTPRASSILNAFLDFDDLEMDDGGPPLDFDDAMAALEAQNAATMNDVDCDQTVLEGECDSSGSTRCSSNCAGMDDASSGLADESGDDAEDDEEDYEDDFESESEYTDSEDDEDFPSIAVDAAEPHGSAAQMIGAARNCASRSQSRGLRARSGSRTSRARDPSLGTVRRSRDPSVGATTKPSRDASTGARRRPRDASSGATRRRRCPALPDTFISRAIGSQDLQVAKPLPGGGSQDLLAKTLDTA